MQLRHRGEGFVGWLGHLGPDLGRRQPAQAIRQLPLDSGDQTTASPLARACRLRSPEYGAAALTEVVVRTMADIHQIEIRTVRPA